MPLTEKGNKIMRALKESYGSSKGEQVFYASKNAGKISGVDCDFDQADFNRAKDARDFKLERDLSPDEFTRLRELLDEWVEEEAGEPEHAE